ncbi:MAG: sigma-54 dependent transcriptional regulator [Myxococcota bacterium]
MTDATKYAASVFVIDDDVSLCEWVSFHLTNESRDVEYFTDATTGLDAVRRGSPDAVILDMDLPDLSGLEVLERIRKFRPELPVIMLTVTEDVPVVVKAMNSGAFDYLTKPVSPERLALVIRNATEQHRLQRTVVDLQRSAEDAGTRGLAGSSPVMIELHRSIEQIAASSVSVLLHGESGTGKELVARAIHDSSDRAAQPFVALNCAAIPETLQEDEFFGHEKGAFTGAQGLRRGRIERAHGGTLFLDEVAELSASMQATLLRVLQEHTFTRVGGAEEIQSDFRLLAATHRDLVAAVAEGEFREDLYYRLAVFELELAPLRERREDIPELVSIFQREMARGLGTETEPGFSADALQLILEHPWPGNVRELRNAVHRAFVASAGGTIRREHLPPRMLTPKQNSGGPGNLDAMNLRGPAPQGLPMSETPVLDRDALDRAHVMQALQQSHGRVDEAARMLGVGRTTLYRKRKKYGLL